MKETIALVLGFFVLAGSGRLFYLGYSRVCTRLQRGGAEEEKSAAPIAMVLTGFSLVTIFVLLIMVYTSLVTGIRLSMGSVVLAGLLLLVLNNLLLLLGYRYSRQIDRQNLSDQLMLQKRQNEVEYYKALEEQYDSQRVLIHDIRKHLAALRDLAGEQGEAARYITELERSPALQNRVRFCGSPILDVILSRYGKLCQESGVGFLVDVRSHSVDHLEQSDVTALFGNLLENAVEAAEGGERPYLELLVDTRPGGALLISLVNTCVSPPESDGKGGFLTRKPHRERHGIGLRSIAHTVKRHNGTLRQYYEEETGLFHTVVLLRDRAA